MNSGLRLEFTFQDISDVSGIMCPCCIFSFLPQLLSKLGRRRVHWILPKSEGKSNAKSVGCLALWHSVTLCRSCFDIPDMYQRKCQDVPSSKCWKRNCWSWHSIFLVLTKPKNEISFETRWTCSFETFSQTCWMSFTPFQGLEDLLKAWKISKGRSDM